MALITSCQASFQSFEDYEQAVEDVEALKVNVQECYSEITKTSEQITSSVREEYVSKSEMELIQQDFQTSITQNSSEIRMDFTSITNEIKEMYRQIKRFWKNISVSKGRSSNLEKSGMPLLQSFRMRNLPLRKTGRGLLIFLIRFWLLPMQKSETSYPLVMRAEVGLIFCQERPEIYQLNGVTLQHKEVRVYGIKR